MTTQEQLEHHRKRDLEENFIRAQAIMKLCIAGARAMILGDSTTDVELVFHDSDRVAGAYGLEYALEDFQLYDNAMKSEELEGYKNESQELNKTIQELKTENRILREQFGATDINFIHKAKQPGEPV